MSIKKLSLINLISLILMLVFVLIDTFMFYYFDGKISYTIMIVYIICFVVWLITIIMMNWKRR